MRISKDQKLEIVRKHLNDGITLRELSEEYGMDQSMLKYNVALYLRHGEGAFTDQSERTMYSRAMKLKAVKRYLDGNESIRLISVDLGLADPTILSGWIKKYQNGGEEALQTSYSRPNYALPEDRQKKIENQEIKERLEHLEAENEYLKKYYSLILERSRRLKKKSKRSVN